MSSIHLPAKIENMELLVQFISDIARKLGFSGKRVKEIELATEEAIVNIINYAYPDHSGNIKVTCTQDSSEAFVIKIEDTGIAFDISSFKRSWYFRRNLWPWSRGPWRFSDPKINGQGPVPS